MVVHTLGELNLAIRVCASVHSAENFCESVMSLHQFVQLRHVIKVCFRCARLLYHKIPSARSFGTDSISRIVILKNSFYCIKGGVAFRHYYNFHSSLRMSDLIISPTVAGKIKELVEACRDVGPAVEQHLDHLLAGTSTGALVAEAGSSLHRLATLCSATTGPTMWKRNRTPCPQCRSSHTKVGSNHYLVIIHSLTSIVFCFWESSIH